MLGCLYYFFFLNLDLLGLLIYNVVILLRYFSSGPIVVARPLNFLTNATSSFQNPSLWHRYATLGVGVLGEGVGALVGAVQDFEVADSIVIEIPNPFALAYFCFEKLLLTLVYEVAVFVLEED